MYVVLRRSRLPGEEGGEGKVVHSRRGRVAPRGAQIDEGQALFPNLTGPSVRPEGSFRSSGSSTDSMAAGCFCPPEGRETTQTTVNTNYLNQQFVFFVLSSSVTTSCFWIHAETS